MSRALAVVALLLLAAPAATAQQAHENFARATTDLDALAALGRTLLNTTEVAITFTVDDDDANATRRARLGSAITADLDTIAQLSDVESASYLAPLVAPYTNIAENTSTLTRGFAAIRGGDLPERLPLVRADVLGMYADADAFDALGHDTTRLRQLLDLLLGVLETIAQGIEVRTPGRVPTPPYMLLYAEPNETTLGSRVVFRGVVVPPPAGATEVRLALDGAPWANAPVGAQGAFRSAYDVPMDARLGLHRVEGETAAHGQLLRASATFVVERIPVLLTLEPERRTFRPDQEVVLRARLVDARGPLADPVATLVVDGGAPTQVSFLADGAAVFRYAPRTFALGTHNATLTFAGDATHAPARATAEWVIALPGANEPPVEQERSLQELARAIPLIGSALAWIVGWLARAWDWLPWLVAILLTLAAEVGARIYLARNPHAFAPETPAARRARAAIERLVPIPRALPPEDPRRIVLLAYRDVLLALAHDGVAIERLTHREIARVLAERGRDPDAIRLVTQTFETVRYAGEPPAPGVLARYLPSVLRLVRPGGA